MNIPVASLVRNSTNNYRGGVRIELLALRTSSSSRAARLSRTISSSTQNSGQTNYGNFTSSALRPDARSDRSRRSLRSARATASTAEASLTANVASWLDLYGQFLYSQPHIERSTSARLDTGNQVLLSQVSVLYRRAEPGFGGSRSCRTPRASCGAEIRPFRRLRILPSWLTDRMHTNGSSAAQQNLTTAAGPLAHRRLAQLLAGHELQPGRDRA